MMNFVHPASIKQLRSELMRSTALTPTQHKKIGWKAVLGVAAATIIPVAAPWVATSLSTSAALAGTSFGTFLGSAAGSTLVGAGLGAGAGYALGGGRGALLGAVGGGLGGYLNTEAPSGDPFFGGAFDSAAAGGPSPAANALLPVPPVTTTVPNAAAGPAGLYTTGGGADLFQGASPGEFSVTGGVTGSEPTFSLAPSSADSGFIPRGGGAFPDATISNVFNQPPSVSAPAPVLAANAAPSTSRFDRFLNSDAVRKAGGELVTKVAGLAAFGDEPDYAAGLSPDQVRARAEQDRFRENMGRLARKKEGVADELLYDARGTDPDAYGKKALATAQQRFDRGRAGMALPRTSASAMRAADARANLDRARLSGAFTQGQQAGEARRLGLLTAAANQLPSGSSRLDAADAFGTSADTQALAALKQQTGRYDDLTRTLGPVFDTAFLSDADLEEEKRKKELS